MEDIGAVQNDFCHLDKLTFEKIATLKGETFYFRCSSNIFNKSFIPD